MLRKATDDQLTRACADNHRRWMCLLAEASGGEVARIGDATLAYVPPPDAEVSLVFPRLRSDEAGAQLDAVLEYCRARPLKQAACWSLLPTTPRDLGARLLARGFEWGWQPHWMAADLGALLDAPTPPGVTIIAVEDESVWERHAHPGHHPDSAHWQIVVARKYAAARLQPGKLWHFVAWEQGQAVGESVVYLSDGRLGVAGIYDVNVVPTARNRGIGRAVTLAACRQAAALGYRFATLNATGMGEPVYRRLGFRSLGNGQTWWLHRAVMDRPPPDAERVEFAEALGRGDTAALYMLRPLVRLEWLDAPLACGLTPLELAASVKKNASAEWLVSHGAAPQVLPLWELGWADDLPALLSAHPEAANQRSGREDATPLHWAAWRGDMALVQLLLAHGADPSLLDLAHSSTPAGWARHAGHVAIAEIISRREP